MLKNEYKKKLQIMELIIHTGVSRVIRTLDRTLRRRMLYPAELWKHINQHK